MGGDFWAPKITKITEKTNGISLITSNATIRSNLIINCVSSFIFTVSNCTNTLFYNNTIINSTERVISQVTGVTGNSHEFKNNIVVNCGTEKTKTFSIATSNTFTHDYNSYSGYLAPFSITGTLYSTIEDYITGTSEDTNSFLVNPRLTQQYYVYSNSPVVAAGTVLGKYRDLIGNVYNVTPSIGAYEYVVERAVR